jgi:hypothetical protein
LTIYHDGQQIEEVELQSISTAEEMHQMMIDKGFRLKSDEEVERIKKEGEATLQKELDAKLKRQERARQKMEKLKAGKNEEGEAASDAKLGEKIKQALKRMQENGVDISAETVRRLEREHNERVRGEKKIVADDDDDIDALPEEEQISPEQVREWKLKKWKEVQEKRRQEGIVDEL